MAYRRVSPSTTWNTLCEHSGCAFPRQIPSTTSTPRYRSGNGSVRRGEASGSSTSASAFSSFSPIFSRRTREKMPSAPTSRSNGPRVVPSSNVKETQGDEKISSSSEEDASFDFAFEDIAEDARAFALRRVSS